MNSTWTQDVESKKNLMPRFGLIDGKINLSDKKQPVIKVGS